MDIEEKKKFDKMEEHIREIQKDISNISHALIGTDLNGKKGLINEVAELRGELSVVKDNIITLQTAKTKSDIYTRQLLFVLTVVITVVVTYLTNRYLAIP